MADNVILMDNYKPQNITQQAKALITDNLHEFKQFGQCSSRFLKLGSFPPIRSQRGLKIKVEKGNKIVFGNDIIDLGYWTQIVERGQMVAIGRSLEYIKRNILINKSQKRQCI